MYVKVVDGEVDVFPYGVRMLKQDNPTVSFPKVLSDETLSEFGIEVVHIGEYPEIDSRTKKVVQDSLPIFNKGQWNLNYSEVDKTEQEISDFDEETSQRNRLDRDELLNKSDWTQISDTPLDGDSKGGWANYRSELRDLTNHINWPNLNEEDWPMKP